MAEDGIAGLHEGEHYRAVGLRAMEEVGQGIPKDVKPGFDMVNYVDDEIGKVYERAADMVPTAQLDQQFADDLMAVAGRRSDLPESP